MSSCESMIRLITQQPVSVWESLQQTGCFARNQAPNISLKKQPAFEWLQNQCLQQSKQFNEGGVFSPLWAWYWYQDEPANDQSIHYEGDEPSVLLEILVPRSEVVLTNYDAWCDYLAILEENYGAYRLTREDALKLDWQASILDLEDASYIQACFSSLTLEQVQAVHPV